MYYAKEEKDRLVRKFFDLQETGDPISVRRYAALAGVKYYTFRDWYRDYKAFAEYHDMSVEEYSEKKEDEEEEISADGGFPFVKITRGGLQECF